METIVVKLGGSALSDPAMRKSLLAQVAALARSGVKLILVHGGGNQIASMLGRLQIASIFHDGLRVTDAETRDVAQMVLAGKIGKDLVAELAREGVRSVSLTGGDGQSFLAERMTAEDGTDIGYVGRVTQTNSHLVEMLTAAGYVPVVACFSLGAADHQYYNVNGDQMAAAVARGCSAKQLIFVTDVGAVRDGAGVNLAQLSATGIRELLESGVASGGMRPKLRACLEALEAGVDRINIVGGGLSDSIKKSVAGERVGTTISA